VSEPSPPPDRQTFRHRRAPRYRAFGITGGLIGLVIGLVLAFAGEPPQDYSRQSLIGYFGVSLMLVGALLGLGVAVLSERRR